MPDDLPVTRSADRPLACDPDSTRVRTADPDATADATPGPSADHSSLRSPSEFPAVPGYEVTREIARGGMGRVLAARDLALEREVALKVLLPGASTAEAARRFVTESKVTARLTHPNIPPVYDLGTLDDGSPFLAMKLVAGRTLAAFLKERAAPTDDLPQLTQAFEQVCLAVGFAHSQGIVHRDLKPANIMIGAFGEVQVMDWGLAKELRIADCGLRINEEKAVQGADSVSSNPQSAIRDPQSHETVAGTVMGTPAYMPPEQARGESVDCRADVFSLGAILCEILTGARPFTGKTSAEVVSRAATGDLAEAVARLDACGGDAELVAVAKRCLAPDAAGRPADGKAVADAIEVYRVGVEARLRAAERDRAAADAKAVEQRKRRRVQTAFFGALALMAFGLVAFGWWDDRQATARRNAAEKAEREKAETQYRQEVRDREAATENRRALAEEVGRCEAALRADAADAATIALSEIAPRESRPGGEEFAGRIAQCRRDHAMLVRLDRADDTRWALVRGQPQHPAVAVPQWKKALTEYGIVPGVTPPTEVAKLLNRSPIRERLIAALESWHLFGERAGLTEILHEVDPNPFRDTFRADVQRGDSDRAVKMIRDLVAASGERKQPPRFVAAVGSVREIPRELRQAFLEQAAGDAPNDFAVLMGLGEAHAGDKRGEIARVRWYQAAMAVRPRSVAPRNGLGIALAEQGKFGEAARCFREAIAFDPANAWSHYNLANVLRHTDPTGALAESRDALRLAPGEPWIRTALAKDLWTKGDLDGALAELREAVRLDPDYGNARYDLGNALRAKRDLKGAIEQYREALRIDPHAADALNALGNALWDTGDLSGAEAAFRKAVASDSGFVPAHNNLGMLLRQARDLKGAIAEYREAIRLDPKYLPARFNLGTALRANKDADGAIVAYRELLELAPTHLPARLNLANILDNDKEDLDGAIAEYNEVLRLDPNNPVAKRGLQDVLKYKAKRDAKIAPPPREVKRP